MAGIYLQAIERMKSRRISFGLRLSLFGTLLITLSVALCAWFAYRFRYEELKAAVANELLAVVNSAAPGIDGDRHNDIFRDKKDQIRGLPYFTAVRAQLQEIKRRNRLSGHGSPVYTMRKAQNFAEFQELEFVVMSDPDKEGVWFVGSRYPVLPHLLSALNGIPATTGLYSDDDGMWISAAAPILNQAGEVVGILQADRAVNYFVAEAQRSAVKTMSIALVCASIGWVLTWVYSRTLVRPILHLAEATQEVANGRLDVKVSLNRNDELGDLARDFNGMARRLETAHAQDIVQKEQMQSAHRTIELSNRELGDSNAALRLSYIEAHRLAAAAEAASRAKSEFLAIMSHELRTPLNSVLGLASLIESSGLDADSTDSARTIRVSGEGLLAMINDVLIYTQLEGDKSQLTEEPFAPAELLIEVMEAFRSKGTEKGLQFQVEINPNLPVKVVGDAAKWQRVLQHLIENAVKFTTAGSVAVRAESLSHGALASEERRTIQVSVRDTGVGVSPDLVPRLFQPFSQSDSSITRQHEGMGLGLALSSRIAKQMGGDLCHENNATGSGSLFVFTAEFTISRTPGILSHGDSQDIPGGQREAPIIGGLSM